MSLFKIKTIWNSTFPQQQFDQRHLTYGLIYNIPTLIIGSYKGILRVYSFNPNTKYANQCFRLSFEKNFQQPIIDVKIVAHPDESLKGNTIGVLLYKKFVYLTLLQTQQPQSGNYTSRLLNVQVQPSFAIIPSPTLSLATLNSSIQSLNPKQTHLIKQSDSIYTFVFMNQDMYYMDGEDLVLNRGGVEQWRVVVGRVRGVFGVGEGNLYDKSNKKSYNSNSNNNNNSAIVLVIIGEMNLWQVNEGKITKCKRLQEQVSTGCIINKPSTNNTIDFNILICNFLTQLLIYSRQYSLLWAVKLDYIPIHILVSESQYLRGAMIMLTDQGTVEVACLGAEVQERQLRVLEESVSMQQVERETVYYMQRLRQLKNSANNAYNSNSNLNSKQQPSSHSQSTSFLTITPTFSQPQYTSQFVSNSQQYYKSQSNQLLKCTLSIQLLTQQAAQLNNCVVTLTKPNNIFCADNNGQQQICIEKLKGKEIVKFQCFISKEMFPYQNYLKVNVRYQKGKSTHFTSSICSIPISFQCQIQSYQALQSSQSKIMFKCTDIPLPAFNLLFGDIMQRGCGQQKKGITFKLMNGVKTSIVYNKNLTKAKIQSQVYSGMCFIFIQFITRIQAYLTKQNHEVKPIEVQVPLKQLQQQIRDYHTYRANLKQQYVQLQSRIDEFKKAEKKLLLKMKQKNSQLQHIYKLLQHTHVKILQAAEQYQQLSEQTNIVNHNFQVSLKLVMQLVYKRSAATQKAIQLAQSIIRFDAAGENVHDQEGWAERLAKGTAYYLNKKYQPTLQNLEKLVTWVITKVNNGDWNN